MKRSLLLSLLGVLAAGVSGGDSPAEALLAQMTIEGE
jgi:hypothetical protein